MQGESPAESRIMLVLASGFLAIRVEDAKKFSGEILYDVP
jgi:hypothetical protein